MANCEGWQIIGAGLFFIREVRFVNVLSVVVVAIPCGFGEQKIEIVNFFCHVLPSVEDIDCEGEIKSWGIC